MRSQKGFTLIEFMISIAVLATVVLSAFYVLTAAKQMSESSRSRLRAANAARSAMEQIKNTALANLGTINTANFIPADLPGGTMTITTNPAVLTNVTLATVTVTVNWTGPKNRPEQLQVTTMRSAY